MKTLSIAALSLAALIASSTAFAQANVRVRGTISEAKGDVLSVKSRDGRNIQLHLAPDTQVVTAKKTTLAEMGPNAYVGVTSVKRPDGRMVAKEVHSLGPQVPAGHIAKWDGAPNSSMTNANIASAAHANGGNEITLKYKDGEQKVLVTPETEIVTFVPGTRADLKRGETIFSGARVEGDGRFVTSRVAVSKGGVKPPQ
jgi:hypothetical protein